MRLINADDLIEAINTDRILRTGTLYRGALLNVIDKMPSVVHRDYIERWSILLHLLVDYRATLAPTVDLPEDEKHDRLIAAQTVNDIIHEMVNMME